MALISDVDYALQAIRLSVLRYTDDPSTPRIISVDPAFALNPYIAASGLADIDRWPEITRALDSPPPDHGYSSADEPMSPSRSRRRAEGGSGGLRYTQTIMAGRSGGLGMRVTGKTGRGGRGDPGTGKRRAESSSVVLTTSPKAEKLPLTGLPPKMDDGFFSPSHRPRADSAPAPVLLHPDRAGLAAGRSMMTSGRGMGVGGIASSTGVLGTALSASDEDEEYEDPLETSIQGGGGYEGEDSSIGIEGSVQPSDLANTAGDASVPLGEEMVDEGSDVEEDEIEDDGGEAPPVAAALDRRKVSIVPEEDSQPGSYDTVQGPLDFAPVSIKRNSMPRPSALTAALNKHIPHLVSTSTTPSLETLVNPFRSLYASVAAPPTVPSMSIELYFPHSTDPRSPLVIKIRKDATVEEVTGYGLFRYWEDDREPSLKEEENEQRWTTVSWGLRIVEDDGEVDEDFPPLDRDSQISKFSYGEFAIVEATESQIKQNALKAPMIQRRPSRIIANPTRGPSVTVDKPSQRGRPNITQMPGAGASTTSLSSNEITSAAAGMSSMKGSVGLTSALSRPARLRIRVTASADVHFTTTIQVPQDMYIADLTEVLCKKKRLAMPSTDWVLCLADLTLALPLDRTVASLEGRTDLALVRRQWAVERGLRIGDRRGGDPSASIFKRHSEPAPLQRYGPGITDFSQTYKKYVVQRKIAIGRHERILAIDGDYIHILPSESRAFFDSMKTTSFHISLVASCKLTGRVGGFKINVWRETGQKRYEFEAENGKQAAEIISSIRELMKNYQAERNSMIPAHPAPLQR